ncbi:MAG: FtsX-like permease family protein [Tissierellia bacterium]|nr:FtsX-like permease family protein [Tissierellia bacterium]
MNAALVSSKRFVVSEQDFQNLINEGSLESLIEFRFFDPSVSTEIENAYVENGLEANGPPAITHSIFKVINLITDGIFIALLMMISLFIVGISLLCVRFTIVAKIEEEYKEIGILKAIGMNSKKIGKIYLSKYVFLAGVSSLVGYLLSFILKRPFIKNIELAMGKGDGPFLGIILGALGSTIVFLIVYLYIKSALRKFKKISPAQALRFGAPISKKKVGGLSTLLLNVLDENKYIGIKDLIFDRRIYFTMALVLVLSVFLILVPMNMYNTIEDRSFMGYLGVGDYDVRIDVSQRDDIEEKATEILNEIYTDGRISDTNLLISRMLDVELESGKIEKLKVEFGNHEKFKVNYLEGKPPIRDDEIALSNMIAKDLEVEYGSKINLLINGEKKPMKVSGIYSDITNGGKTAKAAFETNAGKVLWGVVSISAKEKEKSYEILEDYKSNYPYAKVSDTKEYINQVFGSTILSVGNVAKISAVVTLILVFTLTLLFMRMIYFKNRREVALLKALGFKNGDIHKQYIFKVLIIIVASCAIGIILANTLGELIGSKILSLFGAVGINFISNTLISYLLVPLGLLIMVLIATTLSLRDVKGLKISRFIKE